MQEPDSATRVTNSRRCPSCGLEVVPSVTRCPQDGTALLTPIEEDITFQNKYEFLGTIGEGGMGVVYKARQIIMNKVVAIKMLHPHAVSFDAFRRFQVEGRATGSLNHPNIIAVHDFGTTDAGQPYMVMEYIDGITLTQLIAQKGPLNPHRFLNYFMQVCDALSHAHSRSILHRDIKPSNIMVVQDDDQIRIMDFGIAKVLNESGADAMNLTKTGEAIGSPLYMSPEQSRGGNTDYRSDLYSLGCVMYESLTGAPPFVGGTIVEVVLQHLNEKPLPLSQASLGKKFDPRLEEAIAKLLEKDPAARYQSMIDLKRDLQTIRDSTYSGRALTTFTTSSPEPPAKKSSAKTIAMVAVPIAFIAAAGIYVYSLQNQSISNHSPATVQTRFTETIESLIKKDTESVDLSHLNDELYKITNDDLTLLANDAMAKNINLSGSDIDDAGLSKLSGLKLKQLKLDNTNVEKLTALTGMVSLTDLSLAGTKVEQDGLSVIAQLPDLEHLNLSGTRVMTADLMPLSKLKLKTLELQNCYNLAEIASLRQKLPNCKLTFSDPADFIKVAGSFLDPPKWRQANNNLEAAIELMKAQPEPNQTNLAMCLANSGKCLFNLRDYERAEQQIKSAIEKTKQIDPKSLQLAQFYALLSQVYEQRHQWTKQAQALEEAARVFEVNDCTNQMAQDTWQKLGLNYSTQQSDEKRAIKAFERSIALAKKEGTQGTSAAMTESLLGDSLHRTSRDAQALPHYLKSIELAGDPLQLRNQNALNYGMTILSASDTMDNLHKYKDEERILKLATTMPMPASIMSVLYARLMRALTAQNKQQEAAEYQAKFNALIPEIKKEQELHK